eukprot:16419-Eustigmatos_ZCMA.PRE.1
MPRRIALAKTVFQRSSHVSAENIYCDELGKSLFPSNYPSQSEVEYICRNHARDVAVVPNT